MIINSNDKNLETVILVSVSCMTRLMVLPPFPMMRPMRLLCARIFSDTSLNQTKAKLNQSRAKPRWAHQQVITQPTPTSSNGFVRLVATNGIPFNDSSSRFSHRTNPSKLVNVIKKKWADRLDSENQCGIAFSNGWIGRLVDWTNQLSVVNWINLKVNWMV